jgi:hypothetical protein
MLNLGINLLTVVIFIAKALDIDVNWYRLMIIPPTQKHVYIFLGIVALGRKDPAIRRGDTINSLDVGTTPWFPSDP